MRYIAAVFQRENKSLLFDEPDTSMTLQRSIRLIALLLFVLVLPQFVPAQEAPLNGFDDYVNKALRDWEVPGVAIAVVKNDQIVFAKGYGVRKLGEPTPVNEQTLFAIGSSSKAFTAAAVAMLVDEGKAQVGRPGDEVSSRL